MIFAYAFYDTTTVSTQPNIFLPIFIIYVFVVLNSLNVSVIFFIFQFSNIRSNGYILSTFRLHIYFMVPYSYMCVLSFYTENPFTGNGINCHRIDSTLFPQSYGHDDDHAETETENAETFKV